MASTFQPPILISSEQDKSQQSVFINQNFQNLASALESSSFRIVRSGTTSIPANTVAGTTQIASVEHDLGYVPLVFAFADDPVLTGILPIIISTPSAVNPLSISALIQILEIDTAFVTFSYTVSGAGVTTSTPLQIKYYLLQQPIN